MRNLTLHCSRVHLAANRWDLDFQLHTHENCAGTRQVGKLCGSVIRNPKDNDHSLHVLATTVHHRCNKSPRRHFTVANLIQRLLKIHLSWFFDALLVLEGPVCTHDLCAGPSIPKDYVSDVLKYWCENGDATSSQWRFHVELRARSGEKPSTTKRHRNANRRVCAIN